MNVESCIAHTCPNLLIFQVGSRCSSDLGIRNLTQAGTVSVARAGAIATNAASPRAATANGARLRGLEAARTLQPPPEEQNAFGDPHWSFALLCACDRGLRTEVVAAVVDGALRLVRLLGELAVVRDHGLVRRRLERVDRSRATHAADRTACG
jgi:hypothetical protein